MSKPQSEQSLNISNSVLENVQIAGTAGRDLNVTQIQGTVESITVLGTVQVPQAPLNSTKPLGQQEYRWRKVLLEKVRSFWIEGILAKSLHTQVLIELGLEERSEFVQNPLSEFEEFPSDSGQVFPVGTTAANIFEDIGAGRTLLILGEPGAGKTVTLLKLAESLIARTENDLSQPLPVVLNLSSWAKRRQSIANWLVQEICDIYGSSESLAKNWVAQEQLLLLLDGLDEVDTQYRNDCVKALNQFIQEHGLTEVVVCSRIRDYENLSERLKLRSAIYVQPLTSQQINRFLEHVGGSLFSLKTVLHHNNDLRAFASSPLILSIMSLAYQDCSIETIKKGKTPEAQYQQLFDAYIDRMFTRRRTTQQYSRQKTLRQLIWLAQEMVQTSQTVFLIERLQPTCLPSRVEMVRYKIISSILCCLVLSLIYWIVAFLFIIYQSLDQLNEPWKLVEILFLRGLYLLLVGVCSALVAGFFIGLDGALDIVILNKIYLIQTVEKIKWSWITVRVIIFESWKQALIYTFFGLILFIIIMFYVSFNDTNSLFFRDNINVANEISLIAKLTSGLLWGIFFGLFFGVTLVPSLLLIIEDYISAIKNINRSWGRVKLGLIFGLISGISGGLMWKINGLIDFYLLSLLFLLFIWLILPIAYVLTFGSLGALFHGFRHSDIPPSIIPNQGIFNSAKNSLIFGIIYGLLLGVISVLSVKLTSDIDTYNNLEIFGLCLLSTGISGPVVALNNGGWACLEHFTLRLMLYRLNYAPWDYTHFLNYAVDHLFMQKVGGGYIFVHRMLLEHFAKMKLK